MVHTRPKKPLPRYEPAPGSWSTGGALVANPMSIYPRYKERRSLFHQGQTQPDGSRIKPGVLRYDHVAFGPSPVKRPPLTLEV